MMKKQTEEQNKVPTYEEACAIEGKDPVSNLPYPESDQLTDDHKALNSFARLLVVTRVMRKGVELDFTNPNQWKYQPFFSFRAGVGFSVYVGDLWNTGSYVGSRLSLLSSDDCRNVANQFQSDYNNL